MNHFCTWLHPAPSCPIPALHPARAVNLHETDVRRTWREYAPVTEYGDAYDNCDRLGYLETMGEFQE